MKKIILLIFLLCGCVHFKPDRCEQKKSNYPKRCVISLEILDGKVETKVMDMVKDMCGIDGEYGCYFIDIMNENEFIGWNLICF